MSQIVNDGAVQYGSRDLTIGGVTYATDDFSYDIESTKLLRTNSKNVPNGRVTILGETAGSATLQLADATTPVPSFGAQCTITEGVFTVTKIGRKETKGGITTVPISFDLNITTNIAVS